MLKYNLIASFRNIRRNLSFSLINISGLSLGLTLVIILFTWLKFEYSFDNFHSNADRIFRVIIEFDLEKSSDNFANTPAPLGDLLKKDIPEVVEYVRFGSLGRMLVNYENEQYWEKIGLADPSIFKIFSFNLISGNPETALINRGSIILSETKAKKYFGNKDPLGQTLFLGETDTKTPYIITGVMKDIPANSQLQFDFLGSFSEMQGNLTWYHRNYDTYVLARNTGSLNSIRDKLPEVAKKIPSDEKLQLHIQPLISIHLHSNLRGDFSTNRNMKTVYLISSMLFLVLILACINYMNLATARYTRRGKEAGLRKVTGATNSNLIKQFLCESFAITFLSFIIALFLSYLFLPVFISLTGIPLDIHSLFNLNTFVIFIFLILLISFIAGSYPAFMYSSVNPASTLRDDFKLAGILSVKGLRKGLVIFQFLISIILIASTLFIRSQMVFIKNKNLGLTADQVILVPIYQVGVKPKYELFKNEILASPDILNASAVNYFPGSQGYNQNVWWEGLPENDFSNHIDWIPVDQDFISTLNIKLVKGDFFPKNISGKGQAVYVLNELAVNKTGWNDPIGKHMDIVGKGEVVGIVKNFNFKSLHNEVQPLALTFYPDIFDNLMIKISTENITNTLNFLKSKWSFLFPQYPFEYSFLSDDFQTMYKKETTTSRIITYVSLIALFIACIGLFGLVLFTIDNRTKEIGLRKVAGSTTRMIVLRINLEFIKWILVSFVISCPIVIYIMHKWLENFAYRIHLSWWIFMVAGLFTIVISLLTVSWHTWSAATKNPVDCLKHE